MLISNLRTSLFMLVVCLAFGALCSAQAKPGAGLDRPLAVVAGQSIYDQDLMSLAGPSLLDLGKQEYKVKSDALTQVIRKKLIELEAEKRGLTPEELFKKEVDSKISDPSDEEAKGYYLAVKSQTPLSFDEVKVQVKQLLKNAEIQQAREHYADSLRDKAEVSILLQPPSVQVSYDPARVKGDPDATVTIVEFADFQCPYCGKVEATLKDVLAKYKGKVKLAYQDFPLSSIHPHAEMAAEASRCALAQGKFWEMHDALFANQSNLDQAAVVKAAAGLGLDPNAMESCLKSGKYKTAVQQDVEAGSRAGVTGTPAFFINGEYLSGAQSDTDFIKIIDRLLSAPGSKSLIQASR